MKYSSVILTSTAILAACNTKQVNEKPNILWIILDDTGCDFSCYGNTLINTPVVDSMASKGMMFTQMHVTAPVSSPARSALVTGMYQTSNGTHQHRSSRGKVKIFLEEDKETIPQLFKNVGYYTANTGYDYEAKTDYNFVWNPSMYDTLFRIEEKQWVSPWSFRKEGQAFFIQIQLQGGKNRNVSKRYPVDASKCKPAPYYPNDSLFYYDEASYHSSTLHADKLIGDIMKHLKEDGLDQNTVVMILGDNGQDNYHDKQWLYDGGTHVPFIVYGPEKYIGKAGKVRDDLAIHIDMAPTCLSIAGITIPDYLEGKDLFSSNDKEREYIVTARDRCDWTKDRIRAVRSKDFKYIRNFHPEYSYMQSQYRDGWPMVIKAKELFAQGKLNPLQAAFFQPSRPAEEFYVLKQNSYEVVNEIDNPQYASEIEKHRKVLDEWITKTKDQGEIPETEDSYREACKHVNTNDNNGFPAILGLSDFVVNDKNGSFSLIINNQTHKEYTASINIQSTSNLAAFSKQSELKIAADKQEKIDYTSVIENFDSSDSLIVSVSLNYSFNKSSAHIYNSRFVIKPSPKKIVPKTKIVVDGKMADWIRLPYFSFGSSNKVQFGVAYSDDYLYVGIQVFDINVEAKKDMNPWEQDGVEIRLDARPDPFRSSSIGTTDFTDHLLLAVSPSENNTPVSFYLPAQALNEFPESFFKKDIKLVCKKNKLGYVTEAAIPSSYLNTLQGGDWAAFRLNIIVHNANGIDDRCISWQSKWGSKNDQIGNGTFYK